MRRIIQNIIASLFAILVCNASVAADKIPVVASFSILGDLVQVVGGDRVVVSTLVGPDQDAHTFEPKPADVKTILAAKLVLINGLGFEPWANKLIKAAGYKGVTLTASEGVSPRRLTAAKESTGHRHDHGHDHGKIDPHAWQNPNNVAQYVRNIAASLTKVDPHGASTYQANADAYVKELQALDSWAQAQFAAIAPAQRKVITSHDAFGYLADHYQLQFLAPQGLSTEIDPSAKQVAQLIKQIQREKIKAVFVESMANPKLIAQLSKDAGVTLGAKLYADALSAPGKPAANYLQMVRYNVTQLTQGMRQN